MISKFPDPEQAVSTSTPAEFDVVHYNGIARPGGEVRH